MTRSSLVRSFRSLRVSRAVRAIRYQRYLYTVGILGSSSQRLPRLLGGELLDLVARLAHARREHGDDPRRLVAHVVRGVHDRRRDDDRVARTERAALLLDPLL